MMRKQKEGPRIPILAFALIAIGFIAYDVRKGAQVRQREQVHARQWTQVYPPPTRFRAQPTYASPLPPEVRVPPPSPFLKRTVQQVLAGMERKFILDPEAPVGGYPQYIGTNGAARRISLSGDTPDTMRATLLVALPSSTESAPSFTNNPAILQENKVLLRTFLRNTFPEWKGAAEWAEDAVPWAAKRPDGMFVTHGDKMLVARYVREWGAFQFSVRSR